MTGTMRVPRSRGAFSGLLLILLGAWGALIPFVGPYFNFSYTPDDTWHYTTARLLLEIAPGAGALLGGLLTLGTAHRAIATLGGWLAALSGAWFILGVQLSTIWNGPTIGAPTGATATRQALEYVGFFGGVGTAIVFFAAFALGRFAVVSVRDAELAARLASPDDTGPNDTAFLPRSSDGSDDRDSSTEQIGRP